MKEKNKDIVVNLNELICSCGKAVFYVLYADEYPDQWFLSCDFCHETYPIKKRDDGQQILLLRHEGEKD